MYDLVVIGGGAAGFFTAINAVDLNPSLRVLILEKNNEPLQKVKVSGGGRCNVTHHCYEPELLIKNYPRGEAFLLEPFKRFGPAETVSWFSERGVAIKKEGDGRMFPESNSSQTIIDLFQKEIKRLKIELRTGVRVTDFEKENEFWSINCQSGEVVKCRNLILATGSSRPIWDKLKTWDYRLNAPVPSLFTFKINDEALHALAGNSFVGAKASIKGFSSAGPALITHWGLSGPAILRLSAFAAIELEKCNYKFHLKMDWLPGTSTEKIIQTFRNNQVESPKKRVLAFPMFGFTKRFWEYLCQKSDISEFQNWSETGKKHFKKLADNLKKMDFDVVGKSTFKEEFVTAGGVDLSEINPMSFESLKTSGLYMAGEVLNIDAVTGGFNFQAAWTGGWHIAKSVSKKLDD
ncbi:MAG: putative Rossmann fold flavoprotein [Arcticibacterium sp.]|jgi:predicted Rossmann fold flavoprotein